MIHCTEVIEQPTPTESNTSHRYLSEYILLTTNREETTHMSMNPFVFVRPNQPQVLLHLCSRTQPMPEKHLFVEVV